MEKCRLSDVRRKLARSEHMYLNLTKSAFASRLGVNVCWALKEITLLFQQRKCNNVRFYLFQVKGRSGQKRPFFFLRPPPFIFHRSYKDMSQKQIELYQHMYLFSTFPVAQTTFRSSIRFYYNEFSGLDFAANKIGCHVVSNFGFHLQWICVIVTYQMLKLILS